MEDKNNKKTKPKTTKKTVSKKPTTKTTTTKKSNTTKKVSSVKNKAVNKKPVKQTKPTIKEELKKEVNKVEDSNIKAYKILSYVFLLWLVGLLVPERNDKSLRFHVGQGMILTVVEVVIYMFISLFNEVVVANIFRVSVVYPGSTNQVFMMNSFGILISNLLFFSFFVLVFYFIIIGITNVVNFKDEPLPLLGKYSFYK